jgi:hypothetical protein
MWLVEGLLNGERPTTMLQTKLTDLLGLSAPILQAPIGSARCPTLAAAVSNAGGPGMLALTWKDIESARLAIRETKEPPVMMTLRLARNWKSYCPNQAQSLRCRGDSR